MIHMLVQGRSWCGSFIIHSNFIYCIFQIIHEHLLIVYVYRKDESIMKTGNKIGSGSYPPN